MSSPCRHGIRLIPRGAGGSALRGFAAVRSHPRLIGHERCRLRIELARGSARRLVADETPASQVDGAVAAVARHAVHVLRAAGVGALEDEYSLLPVLGGRAAHEELVLGQIAAPGRLDDPAVVQLILHGYRTRERELGARSEGPGVGRYGWHDGGGSLQRP